MKIPPHGFNLPEKTMDCVKTYFTRLSGKLAQRYAENRLGPLGASAASATRV